MRTCPRDEPVSLLPRLREAGSGTPGSRRRGRRKIVRRKIVRRFPHSEADPRRPHDPSPQDPGRLRRRGPAPRDARRDVRTSACRADESGRALQITSPAPPVNPGFPDGSVAPFQIRTNGDGVLRVAGRRAEKPEKRPIEGQSVRPHAAGKFVDFTSPVRIGSDLSFSPPDVKYASLNRFGSTRTQRRLGRILRRRELGLVGGNEHCDWRPAPQSPPSF